MMDPLFTQKNNSFLIVAIETKRQTLGSHPQMKLY